MSFPNVAPAWLPEPVAALVVAAVMLCQTLLLVYSGHRALVLWRWWRLRRGDLPEGPAPPGDPALPFVTVQLPVYNERRVVERLIEAASALDWPAGKLEIQVLDDSDDDTSGLAAAAVARMRARGADIVHVRRAGREGCKAGALSHGLARARGEWIAVFDADFVPPPGFLRGLVRHLADPDVGMVQARWEHLNRGRSWLTRAQAVLLDAHFLLEHEARRAAGLFFNFNGTAGVWRRECIEASGGWTHDTLTEDLDLSYRAQLAGWRFAFEPAVTAPAELPEAAEALRSQQRRWARGSIQTARKLLPRLLAAPLPARVKLEAVLHLTGNAAYPLLLAMALLLPWALVAYEPRAGFSLASAAAALLALGFVPLVAFLAAGQWVTGRRGGGVAADVAAALLLGVGLSLNNALAVIAGLGRDVGSWERTPKAGDGRSRAGIRRYPLPAASRHRSVELAVSLYAAAAGLLALAIGAWHALPFAGLLVAGFGAIGLSGTTRPKPPLIAPTAGRSSATSGP